MLSYLEHTTQNKPVEKHSPWHLSCCHLDLFSTTHYNFLFHLQVKFKGRISYKMYMLLKPTKFGIKIWARCNDNGYLQQFEIYLGNKETSFPKWTLLWYCWSIDQIITGENHQVFFDNLYTSVPLMVYLRNHGILAAGTACANRKGVPDFFRKPPKMQRGEHKTVQDKNNRFLTATAWKDTGKFPVKFLSTLSQPTIATHCKKSWLS